MAQPDLSIILKVIHSLSMDGSPPFPELTDFRLRCLQALPVSHVLKMTLSEILRAYIAAYQPACIWKECFTAVVGVLSDQSIKE